MPHSFTRRDFLWRSVVEGTRALLEGLNKPRTGAGLLLRACGFARQFR